jgi:hypothetical protein
MTTLNRFQKQRNTLVNNMQMQLKLLMEYKVNGVSLYDNEIVILKERLNTLKNSKQYKNENHIHQ